ncbi:MAG: SDR family NAD(P)-dependent oxidoreductase [Gemmatimonadales bacterium]
MNKNGSQQRVALVTGSSRGLGYTIAARLADEGYDLVVTARGTDALERARGELASTGRKVVAIPADLTRRDDRERLVQRVLDEMGRIDVLINNAGSGDPVRFVDTTADTLNHIIELDLVAPIHLTQLVLPEMLANGSGSVVNISSMLAKMPFPLVSLYGAAKSGLDYFTASLHQELKDSGVTVSYVSPGGISDDGFMVAMIERTGVELGKAARMTLVTTDRVAGDVLKAIRKGRVETLSTRGGRMIKKHPKFGAAMMRRFGMYDFLNEVAKASTPTPADAPSDELTKATA